MSQRYAIYYVPQADSALAQFGEQWLNTQTAITHNVRRYGFHATLKAPFVLQAHASLESLLAAVERLAASQKAFVVPDLEVARLGAFLALVLREPCPTLQRLAAQCVQSLDAFRAPLSAADFAKRPDARLTPRQQVLRQAWGYPYVLDEFRFHMTLTDAVPDAEQRARYLALAQAQWLDCAAPPVWIDSLCLYTQATREAPFSLQQRFSLG